jgi:hypothetical protein
MSVSGVFLVGVADQHRISSRPEIHVTASRIAYAQITCDFRIAKK